jgi:MFS family permease
MATQFSVGATRWSAMPVLMAGVFLIVLDFFIVNVALPAIQAGLHAGADAIEWVVAGYGLAFAVLIVTAGRIADQAGRRRMLVIGLAGFTAASAACGLAPSAEALVAFRVVQGAAAAVISPAVLAIVGVTYHGPDRARALAVYGVVMGLAAAGGQIIGGLLVQADVAGVGWRAIFLVNLPVGAAALALAPRLVAESRAGEPRPLDPAGMVLVTSALTAIVLPLIEGRAHGWPLWTWPSLAAGLALLGAFAAQQRRLVRRGGAPLLDPAPSRRGPLPPGWPPSSCSGAPRHRATCSSRSTCRKGAASTPCTPAWSSRSSPGRIWPPRCARPR